jgi:hypothetical protein
MNLCDFSQLCKYYVKIICTKGKREQKWKHVMNLVMIQLFAPNTIQKWKLTKSYQTSMVQHCESLSVGKIKTIHQSFQNPTMGEWNLQFWFLY